MISKKGQVKRDNDQKSLASFGQKIRNKNRTKSPSNNLLFHEAKSRPNRVTFEERQNHSMLGIIDDNSNNIEPKFLFGNESRLAHEEHSMSMMFKNQNSNHYLAYHGTPNKAEVSQQNIFDHGENSNISAIFPITDPNDDVNRKLSYKEALNDDSQFGINVLQGHSENIHDQESVKEKEVIVETHQDFENFQQPFLQTDNLINNDIIQETDRKMNEDIVLPNADSKEECSLPHPNVFFNLKNGKNKYDLKSAKSESKSITKQNKQKKRNRKNSRKRKKNSENR
jgi:hypothetical protein